MWIDINNGTVRLADDMVIMPGFSYEEFQRSKYYRGQDEVRVMDFEEPITIKGAYFCVGIRFVNHVIYSISLVQLDDSISFENEIERKNLHDQFLLKCGIRQKEYAWGSISSGYDRRGNTSSIDIYYRDSSDRL